LSTRNCILLNEINSSPKLFDANNDGVVNDSDEFIELVNVCEDEILLQGYIIDDVENGGSAPYVIQKELIIGPNQYLVFFRDETKILLNNSNEEVYLLNPNGDIMNKFSFVSSNYDKSFQYNPNWEIWLTSIPTVGVENLKINQFPISEIPLGNTVEILARVVDDGLVYQDFYLLQDDSESIRVKIDSVSLEKGKSYLLLGNAKQLSTYSEFTIISYIESEIEFTELVLKVSEIDDNLLDMRVCIDGAIVEVNDTSFVLSDDRGDSIKVQLEVMDNVDTSKLVNVCGIVKLMRSKYELIAEVDDISYKKINKASLTQTGQNISIIIVGWILLLVCAILSAYKFRMVNKWLSLLLLKKRKKVLH